MMSLCTSWNAQYRDGEHRLEFVSDNGGEMVWKCKDCGETEIFYSDHQGC